MKQKINSLWLVTLLMLACQSLSAHNFEVGGIYYAYLSKTDKTVCVSWRGDYSTECSNEYSGNVVIPESVKYSGTTYSVTSIGYRAFEGCTGLTSIEIPNSVTSIGDWAFYGCTRLTSIEIPNSVTSIGCSVFSGCTGLTSIEIPSSVTSISVWAFNGCTGLTSIEIPSSVTSIGSGAFCGCTGTLEVHCDIQDASSNSYGWFYSSKFNKVVIGNEVTKIGGYAFSNCTGLTSVEIPNSVTSIGYSAFSGCTGLTSIEIPSSVTSIGDSAFSNCQGTLTINSNIDNFLSSEEGGFSGAKFSEIVVGDSVARICKFAFADMTNLRKITIGKSVNRILGNAFTGCIHLTEMYCKPTTPPACASTVFDEDTYLDCTVFVPDESLDKYQTANVWRNFFDMDVNPDYRPDHKLIYRIDGSIVQSITIEEGATITAIEAPVREGYTFLGWSGLPDDMTMPDEDLVVFGSYAETITATELAVNDGDVISFPLAHTYETVNYSRTFSSADKWQAFYVPFSIPVETLAENGLEVAELNDTHMYDTDDDGEFDQTTLEFLYLKCGATEPNYPYLIKSASAGDVTLTMTGVEVKATEETEIECSTTRAVFKIRGTYAGVSGAVMYANNYYAMGGGTLVRMANADSGLKPQRWYLAVENKDGSPAEFLAAQMRITIDGIEIEESETAISEVNAIGQKQDEVYMLDGRKVNGTDALKSGLYVKNHKKLFVR